MSKSYVRDESTGKIIGREPVYESSGRLTEIARSILGVHDGYKGRREADESKINYFPAGKIDARRKDAAPALAELLKLLGQARDAGASAVNAASARVSAALRKACPDVSEAGNAIIAVATAQMVANDATLRARLISLSKLFALADADLAIIRWLVYLPPLLTKLQPSEIASMKANLALDETRALFVAEDEAEQIRNHVAHVADVISKHASVATHELPDDLQSEIFALYASMQPNIQPRRDTPDEPATPEAESTSSTDAAPKTPEAAEVAEAAA